MQTKEEAKARALKWRKRNLERARANTRAWAKANPDRNKALIARWRKANPEKEKEYQQRSRLKKYGITQEQFDFLWTKQQKACSICKSESQNTKWCIDHDHSSGTVRGILCDWCNKAIGLFEEDINRFERAIAYLKGD